ncbi:glycine cleavage system protein H [Acidithiobacillus ferrianus]|uniref:Glycine cleavage system protein H n=2 Tax=Acidithiobacillus ferrianus TaxID=2678518 RepID=A0ACD5H7P1_9PROT|nr:glycine cleavage system protein H [Acidithiobacillus ferrianus]MDA8153813.1 glycine cleavage system protein H [Acidithiobacillus sp.]
MMGIVRGCEIPEDLMYNVDNNVWLRKEDDGSVTIGMTSYACALAGQIVSYTPKGAGKDIKKDKSAATVESGKWVGPLKSPVSGTVVSSNDEVAKDPGLINKDPYGSGWIAKLTPTDFAGDSGELKTGADALTAFEEKMTADGFGGC